MLPRFHIQLSQKLIGGKHMVHLPTLASLSTDNGSQKNQDILSVSSTSLKVAFTSISWHQITWYNSILPNYIKDQFIKLVRYIKSLTWAKQFNASVGAKSLMCFYFERRKSLSLEHNVQNSTSY